MRETQYKPEILKNKHKNYKNLQKKSTNELQMAANKELGKYLS